MKDIDERIREVLRKEDAELLEEFRGEPGICEMLIETFRGRFRWINALAFAWTIVVLGLLVVLACCFFQTESTRAMIACATAFVWGLLWIVMMKIWFWFEISRNSLTREIKRLELQLAHLSRRLAAADEHG